MNARRIICLSALVLIGVFAGRTLAPAMHDDATQREETDSENLAVRLAEARLELAELDLARVRERNENVGRTLLPGLVRQFRQESRLAKHELELAREAAQPDPYQTAIARLRLSLTAAKDRADRAYETFERAPETMTRQDVLRMRQLAKIANLQLQRGLALENASKEEQMAWQLELLGSEMGRLRLYTYLLGQDQFPEFAPGL